MRWSGCCFLNCMRTSRPDGTGVGLEVIKRSPPRSRVRAIWLHHGASDEWLERFAAPMAPGQLAEPVLGPNVDAMLQTLAKTAPPFLAQTLGAFKAATWQPMNSYVLGGIRPVVQSLAGSTPRQLVGVLQNGNGMALMTANLLVVALQDPALAGRIGPIQQAHQACLPPMQSPRT